MACMHALLQNTFFLRIIFLHGKVDVFLRIYLYEMKFLLFQMFMFLIVCLDEPALFADCARYVIYDYIEYLLLCFIILQPFILY